MPDAQRVVDLSVPVAIALLVVYAVVTVYTLRRHHIVHVSSDDEIDAWSFKAALAALGVATVVTALVAEILVGSLETFAEKVGLSDFFVAAVIVAIVGNAAEHGGAVIVAHRGKIKLAAEIALSSSAQVAVFLIPAVVVLSWLIDPLALGFRPVEIAALAVSLRVVMVDDLERRLVPAPRLHPDRRLHRCRGDVLRRRRRLGRYVAEGRRRPCQRVGHEVELRHRPVVVAHRAQELAALAPLDDAPAVDAVGLEPGDVAAGRAADQLGPEAAAAEGQG